MCPCEIRCEVLYIIVINSLSYKASFIYYNFQMEENDRMVKEMEAKWEEKLEAAEKENKVYCFTFSKNTS